MSFYEFCSVKKLTDCTDVLEITQMFLPCPELQLYMHRAVPALQRYLRVYKYNPDVYQELQKQNISQRLAAMQFFKVGTLNIIVKFYIWLCILSTVSNGKELSQLDSEIH